MQINSLSLPRRFLPEWHVQDAVMLIWPHACSDWAATLDVIEPFYIELCRHITHYEKAVIIHTDQAHRSHISGHLVHAGINLETILWCEAKTNDTWIRDYGPLTIDIDGRPTLLNFRFNAWGDKYAHEWDEAFNRNALNQGCFSPMTGFESIDLILEGGCIDTDGEGTVMAHRRCLLSTTRNGNLPPGTLIERLKTALGINRLLLVDQGAIIGDDTDCHIDTLARFCNPRTIAYVHSNNPADAQHEQLVAMRIQLESWRTLQGEPYKLIPLPIPTPCYNQANQRLPATYANFLIINDAVLVPTYRDDIHDHQALETLSSVFPDRQIIGIDAIPAIQQYGSLHCLTMQIPEGIL